MFSFFAIFRAMFPNRWVATPKELMKYFLGSRDDYCYYYSFINGRMHFIYINGKALKDINIK